MKTKGQSLIEVVAALAVMTIVLLSLVALTTYAVRNASFARDQSLATQYAQEEIDKIRQSRDADPVGFFDGSCSRGPEAVGEIFARQITCELVETEKMKVVVTVSWLDAKGTHQSELTTYLTKWK